MGLKADYDMIELPSIFEAVNRPFVFVDFRDSTTIDYKTSDKKLSRFMRGIDRLIRDRKDRRGLIQSRSFFWAERIVRGSRQSSRMIRNCDSSSLEMMLKMLRSNRGRGKILVSPSVDTGIDFPGEQARFNIIWKVPFPDRRTDLMELRCKVKGFVVMLIKETILQMYGRSTRSATDWSETFILDRHWLFFYRENASRFPLYFRKAYRVSRGFPEPMTRPVAQG